MMEKHIYKIFADKWYRGGNIYLYSDPHFNDDEMQYIRKNYISDEEQLKRINSKVGKNDTIIILGDCGDLEWIKKIRGYKVLIMGNHDSGASNYQRDVEEVSIFSSENMTEEDRALLNIAFFRHDTEEMKRINEKYTTHERRDNKLFDEVYEGPLMISDKIILSHEPIPMGQFHCFFNIHGHDHSNWQSKDIYHMNLCAEHIDYTPVSLKDIIRSGKLKPIENIHRLTIDEATLRKERRAMKEGVTNNV